MNKHSLWSGLALSSLLWVAPATAYAHFVWVVITAGDAPEARVYFAEAAEPDSAPLIKKIAQTKGWVRSVQGEPQPLAWQEAVVGDEGWLAAKLPAKGAVEASCRYGVISRGGASFLLNYYAKAVQPAQAQDLDVLGRAAKLDLDIVPRLREGALECTVLWKGQPLADCELLVIDPAGKSQTLKTGAKGEISLPATQGGLYALRAKHVEADAGGEEQGQKYTETRHYSTLTLRLPL